MIKEGKASSSSPYGKDSQNLNNSNNEAEESKKKQKQLNDMMLDELKQKLSPIKMDTSQQVISLLDDDDEDKEEDKAKKSEDIRMKEEHVMKSLMMQKYRDVSQESRDGRRVSVDREGNELEPQFGKFVDTLRSQRASISIIESSKSNEKSSRSTRHSRSQSRSKERLIMAPDSYKGMNLHQVITIKREENEKPEFRKQVYRKLKAVFEGQDKSNRGLASRIALGIESRVNQIHHYTGEEYVMIVKAIIEKYKVTQFLLLVLGKGYSV